MTMKNIMYIDDLMRINGKYTAETVGKKLIIMMS
jgi:hypothetical protein